MQRMKVVTKKEIETTLWDGGYIKWSQIEAKAYLLDSTREVIGSIRFDTYLSLDLREVNMKMPVYIPFTDSTFMVINDEASPFYRLKRFDAWQGYDLYQLRPAVLNDLEDKQYYLKRIWR